MQTPREQRVPSRVVVADDQESSRLALCAALRRAGVVVVAEAFDGTEAVELARYHQPDLVIIDVGVPGLDAIAATRRITSQRPQPIVILLTGTQTEALGPVDNSETRLSGSASAPCGRCRTGLAPRSYRTVI